MNWPIVRGFAVAAVLAVSIWACGETTTPTTPTPTPVEKVTDTFTGTLAPQGFVVHTFQAKAAGTVTTTLTAVGPDSTLVLGVSVGTWDGFTCTSVVGSQTAQLGSVLVGTATAAVNLCVYVYDVGNIIDSATYTVQVVHY